MRREYDVDGGHWNMVESPDGLGPDPDEWDRVIARQRDFFAERGPAGRVEDLRLRRAGRPRRATRAMPASSRRTTRRSSSARPRPWPPRTSTCPTGSSCGPPTPTRTSRGCRTMLEAVWGKEQAWVTDSLLPRWRRRAGSMDVVVVEESREGPVLCAARARVRRERVHRALGRLDPRRVARPRPLPRDPAAPRPARPRARQGLRPRRRLARLRADPAPPRPAPGRDDDPYVFDPRSLTRACPRTLTG